MFSSFACCSTTRATAASCETAVSTIEGREESCEKSVDRQNLVINTVVGLEQETLSKKSEIQARIN